MSENKVKTNPTEKENQSKEADDGIKNIKKEVVLDSKEV